MTENIQINSVEQLKELFTNPKYGSNGCVGEFFIQLNFCRSWKLIYYSAECDLFTITNEIDDSEQELTTAELFDPQKSNIGEAINKGAFYFAWF